MVLKEDVIRLYIKIIINKLGKQGKNNYGKRNKAYPN